MALLNINDIFQFSVILEKHGEKFYRKFAEIFENPNLKNFFTFLAEEEVKHAEIFAIMLAELGKNDLAAIYPEEYQQYLNAYLDNHIFHEQSILFLINSSKHRQQKKI